jgi:hypothetical protein
VIKVKQKIPTISDWDFAPLSRYKIGTGIGLLVHRLCGIKKPNH